MTILGYRFLDWFQSFIRRKGNEIRQRRKWGSEWRDKTRPGRTFTRIHYVETERDDSRPIEDGRSYDLIRTPTIRPEPGWEWTCPNCKEYSIITESMMPEILAPYFADLKRMTNLAAAKGITYKIGPKPTAATAGCTNCRYRPGAPE